MTAVRHTTPRLVDLDAVCGPRGWEWECEWVDGTFTAHKTRIITPRMVNAYTDRDPDASAVGALRLCGVDVATEVLADAMGTVTA